MKPKYLYRGIHLNYDEFKNFDLNQPLVVPYPPLYDNNHREIVSDGNEYGVYMTDNLRMAEDVYGNSHSSTNLYPEIRFRDARYSLALADIGIVYQIDTDNLDVHKPWIKEELMGHYNNSYNGDEWIAKSIPTANYKILRVRIGDDLLHSSEDVPIDDNLKENVMKILNTRLLHFQALVKELKKHDGVIFADIDDFLIYKEIFGNNGFAYASKEDFDVSSFDGIMQAVSYGIYTRDTQNINYVALKYLKRTQKELNKSQDQDKMDALVTYILSDIDRTNRRRDNALKRMEETGEEVVTSGFENKLVMLKNILRQVENVILLKINQANDQVQK